MVPEPFSRFNKTIWPFLAKCIGIFSVKKARYIDIFNIKETRYIDNFNVTF